MIASLKFNTDSFNADLKKAIELSSRSGQEVVNSRSYFVAKRALESTIKANVSKIEWQLGQIGTSFKVTKTGKLSRTRAGQFKKGEALLADDSFAARIVNALRKKRGEPLIWGAELIAAAQRLISARKRSVGYIKSGWIWVMRDLARAAKMSRPSGLGFFVGKTPKGKGIPARKSTGLMKATLENSALIAHDGHNPLPIAEEGLRRALEIEQDEMQKHLAEKMKADLKSAGFRIQ